jgi:LuxR family maltose regulon positive regulatory protein
MTGDVTQSISVAFILADIRTAQGRLREAARIYEEWLKLAEDHGEPMPPLMGDLYVGMSELNRERGDLEAASRCLQTSKELGERGGMSENRHRWYVAMARIKEARGDPDRALDLLDEAERLYIRSPDPDTRPIAALKARVWAAQGRLAEARDWARERSLSVHDDDLSYLREFEYVTLTRVLMAEYRRDHAERSIHEAMELLERLLKAAEEGGRAGSVIEILALQALAHEAQGDSPSALVPLERALSLAEPEGYVRIFVDEGVPMARLLYDALALDVEPEYVRRLLAAYPVAEPEQITSSRLRGSKSELVEPLSERELEVLQLIAAGRSNRRIASELFVSVGTVKTHVNNLYRKLDSHSRTQAVARARELKLL